MEVINNNGLLLHDLSAPPSAVVPPPPPPPAREKTKRPQLSCNPCRARKVKCDRIQPCSACSLHQIAEICRYDLSETERQPILQAEALKEKDRTIASLRNEVASLRGGSLNAEADERGGAAPQKMRLPPRSPKRLYYQDQNTHQPNPGDDHFFRDEPGVTNIADDFNHLSFDRRPATLACPVPHGGDISGFQMATSHPFPTLWSAKDDTSTLIRLLPPEQDLFFYLEAFGRRSQAFSFPHVPEQVTIPEVRRFIVGLEHNAALYPDMLALLFATLAQGLQDGVYDKFGEKWTAGNVEVESKKGDVYIAAAMQCLRLAAFMNRPTLLVIQTLVMMGPYLTNRGKFLDASGLFGGTVRLAQSIGCKRRIPQIRMKVLILTRTVHRDPTQLNTPITPKDAAARRSLWWWMLHMDQQYSMTLGRPLAVSSMGDCPSPEPMVQDPIYRSVSKYITQFSLLGRQILSATYLGNDRIDKYTDDLLRLQKSLPSSMQFASSWLNRNTVIVSWPLDVQAALLHARAHNFLISLNRRRTEIIRRNSEGSHMTTLQLPPVTDVAGIIRGRPRVLASCRALLSAFEFFHTRIRAGMICWSMGQMAFNASMLLTLSMLETGETQDLLPVQHAYSTFLEMNKLGIHKLAGAAVERLGRLMKEFPTEDSANETVMGQQGMLLLEDPGSHSSMPESFAGYQTTTSCSAGTPKISAQTGQRTKPTVTQRKRASRRTATPRDGGVSKSRQGSINKGQRSAADRRFSDSMTPRPGQRRRINRSTPNLSLLTSVPDQSIFTATSTPAVKSETLFTPLVDTFDSQSTTAFTSPSQPSQELRQILDEFSPPHSQDYSTQHPSQQFQSQQQYQHRLHIQQQPQPQQHSHQQQNGLNQQQMLTSQPSDNAFDFSNTSTPYSSEFFDSSLPSGVGHSFDDHHLQFEHQPFSAPPFSMPADQTFAGAHF
ncbi:MAG: hypothetical protein Q9217_006735 [Psora testacea]